MRHSLQQPAASSANAGMPTPNATAPSASRADGARELPTQRPLENTNHFRTGETYGRGKGNYRLNTTRIRHRKPNSARYAAQGASRIRAPAQSLHKLRSSSCERSLPPSACASSQMDRWSHNSMSRGKLNRGTSSAYAMQKADLATPWRISMSGSRVTWTFAGECVGPHRSPEKEEMS